MDKGLIKSIGRVSAAALASYKDDLITIDANNSWVTPGLVDMHSQLGNRAAPYLAGASDDWLSNNGNIQVSFGDNIRSCLTEKIVSSALP